jgi:hypothetical protein
MMWGVCGTVVYIFANRRSMPWEWWFAAGSAVLAGAVTGLWFIKPRGSVTVDERSRTLVVEHILEPNGLRLWPRKRSATISFDEVRDSMLVPSRYSLPSLRIRTDRGIIYVPGGWSEFSAVCDVMSRLQDAPLQRTAVWIGLNAILLLIAFGICAVIMLAFNWP